jgi:hypothetical protein
MSPADLIRGSDTGEVSDARVKPAHDMVGMERGNTALTH